MLTCYSRLNIKSSKCKIYRQQKEKGVTKATPFPLEYEGVISSLFAHAALAEYSKTEHASAEQQHGARFGNWCEGDVIKRKIIA
ncbi:MAG: hypothetical protein H6Q56_155 [Deltaproteobacteria bacterium]|nr:hypothetical protein [Deltaproteobacteria bacterium]